MCVYCQMNGLAYAPAVQEAPVLAMAAAPSAAPPSTPQAAASWALQSGTGTALIDGVLSGYKWGSSTITYSFPISGSGYGFGYTEAFNGFMTAPEATRNAIRAAMGMIASYTNLTLTEISGTSADIRVAFSNEPDTAWAYYPDSAEGGDVWFGKVYPEYQDPVRGDYGWMTALHELGHAFGLKHGHEVEGAFNALPTANDHNAYSIMTYRSYQGASTTDGATNEDFGFSQTYMMADIAAFQAMYGANFSTNSGNSTYSWDPLTGEMRINGVGQGQPGANRIFMTVWDGGGSDTYDFSDYANGVTVNLTPGGYSITSATQKVNLGDGRIAIGNVFNALQYQGDTRSLIENAIGGNGNDRLVGNGAANLLQGGAGNDILEGGAGSDILEGGTGSDTLSGGDGDDIIFFDSQDATSGVTGGAGFDTLRVTGNFIPTTFNLAGQGFEAARTQITDTGQAVWQVCAEIYSAGWLVGAREGTFDSGKSWADRIDTSKILAITTTTEMFDTNARLNFTLGLYDDGRTFVTDYDQTSTQSWSQFTNVFTTSGAFDYRLVQADNGTAQFVDFDEQSRFGWDYYINTFSADGRLISQDLFQDGGGVVTTSFGANETRNLTDYTAMLSANGVNAHRAGSYDGNGSWRDTLEVANDYVWMSRAIQTGTSARMDFLTQTYATIDPFYANYAVAETYTWQEMLSVYPNANFFGYQTQFSDLRHESEW
jgi:serralysin